MVLARARMVSLLRDMRNSYRTPTNWRVEYVKTKPNISDAPPLACHGPAQSPFVKQIGFAPLVFIDAFAAFEPMRRVSTIASEAWAYQRQGSSSYVKFSDGWVG